MNIKAASLLLLLLCVNYFASSQVDVVEIIEVEKPTPAQLEIKARTNREKPINVFQKHILAKKANRIAHIELAFNFKFDSDTINTFELTLIAPDSTSQTFLVDAIAVKNNAQVTFIISAQVNQPFTNGKYICEIRHLSSAQKKPSLIVEDFFWIGR